MNEPIIVTLKSADGVEILLPFIDAPTPEEIAIIQQDAAKRTWREIMAIAEASSE